MGLNQNKTCQTICFCPSKLICMHGKLIKINFVVFKCYICSLGSLPTISINVLIFSNLIAIQVILRTFQISQKQPESSAKVKYHFQKKTYKWAMETRGPKSNSSERLCLSWLPATLMMIRSKIYELAWRHHFPIISLWEIF